MEEKSTATLEKIQRAAMEEFSEKGFQGASLRQIVKQAGVTTGALYGYFSSKEALFASIVEPHAAALMGRFMEAQTAFAEMPEKEQPDHMGLESSPMCSGCSCSGSSEKEVCASMNRPIKATACGSTMEAKSASLLEK